MENDYLQIIGRLYTDLYRAQSVLQQLQNQLQENEKTAAEQKTAIGALEQELNQVKTKIEAINDSGSN